MTMNGHPKPNADLPILSGQDLPVLTEHLPGSHVVEFSLPLHVSKRCGQDGKPDVYTIAIWWNAVLLPLCQLQSLENAVVPLRSLLERVTLPAECVEERTTWSQTSVTWLGHKGYFIVGLYPNGDPGELFITMAKEGSTVSGLMSSFAQVVSISLQHGVPLALLCEKFGYTRFEPSGFTGNPEIPMASSIMDYIFRWLRLRFLTRTNPPQIDAPQGQTEASVGAVSLEAPFCVGCGALMVRSGACFICSNCGSSSGCG